MADEKKTVNSRPAHAASPKVKQKEETLYKADYMGSGTFSISKPKRKNAKRRQSALKGTVRGARK